MKNLSYILLFFLLAFVPLQDEVLEKIRQQWQVYQGNLPHEYVYLSFSEEVITAGDTLWFGGYLRHQEAASKVLYLELTSDQATVQKETYSINKGFVSGQLSLPDSLSSGIYHIRAYTQWMRNGRESDFFRRSLLVINPYDEAPPAPEHHVGLDTRLQIVPEGGQWVKGLPARLRVSVGGQENQNLSGSILRQEDTVKVADIQLENGVDMISLRPADSISYRAEVYLASGDTLTALLPTPRQQGVTLMVDLQNDRLNISTYNKGSSEKKYLLVRSQDTLLHSSLLEDTATMLTINPNIENTALLEISVVNAQAQVLAERLLYYSVAPLPVQIKFDKNQYAPREEVSASLSLPEGVDAARLSVSSRKVNSLSSELTQNIALPWSNNLSRPVVGMPEPLVNQWLVSQRSPFLAWQEILSIEPKSPVHRKEDEYFLLSGRLTDPSGSPINDEMTLLSVPGNNPHFDYYRTDSSGRFYLPVYDVYGEKEVVFQLQNDSLQAEWVLEDKFASLNNSSTEEDKTPLFSEENWVETLESYRQRSRIRTQYENFFNNEEKNIPRKSRFYGAPNFEVRLDDYISLPDFVEVCRELMPGIRLRKEGDNYVFSVFDVRTRTFLENPPALLLDGVLIDDPDIIVSLAPSDIDRIETVNRRTYYGEYRFDGMVAVYTREGNAYQSALPPSAEQKNITFLTPLSAYQPGEKMPSHQPDLRTLLMWVPALTLNPQENKKVSFRTSDELGEFEFVVEGVTTEGRPVYSVHRYQVSMDQWTQ